MHYDDFESTLTNWIFELAPLETNLSAGLSVNGAKEDQGRRCTECAAPSIKRCLMLDCASIFRTSGFWRSRHKPAYQSAMADSG